MRLASFALAIVFVAGAWASGVPDVNGAVQAANGAYSSALSSATSAVSSAKSAATSAATSVQAAKSSVAQTVASAATAKLASKPSIPLPAVPTKTYSLPTTIPKPDTTITVPDVKYESPEFDFSGFPEHSVTTPEVSGVDISPITDALSHGKGAMDKSIPEINVHPPQINYDTPAYSFKLPPVGKTIGKAINGLAQHQQDTTYDVSVPGTTVSLPAVKLPSHGKGSSSGESKNLVGTTGTLANIAAVQGDKPFVFPISVAAKGYSGH